MKFTLTINLGNDAMQTGADLAAALREAADRLAMHEYPEAGDREPIVDLNGNLVGHWIVTS